jgi:hypothetical protein
VLCNEGFHKRFKNYGPTTPVYFFNLAPDKVRPPLSFPLLSILSLRWLPPTPVLRRACDAQVVT